jgi:mono/diheme cytochrome c family protein
LLTEIPEHLLRRSRERRAALGLPGAGGDEGDSAGGPPAASAGPAETRPARAASTEVAPTAAASTPAVVEEAPPPPTYIAPRGPHKTKVPLWVMPVLIALPLWAFLYPGAFGNHHKAASADPLTIGSQVYHSAGCSGCHGAAGEGGVGPALHAGESVKTFPNVADQIAWVKDGSQSLKQGTPYGDPNRAGGQRTVKETAGDMPPFGSTLSPAQIQAVVQYEREKL